MLLVVLSTIGLSMVRAVRSTVSASKFITFSFEEHLTNGPSRHLSDWWHVCNHVLVLQDVINSLKGTCVLS